MRDTRVRPGTPIGASLAALLAGALLSGCASMESVFGPIGTPSSSTQPKATVNPDGEASFSDDGQPRSADIDCPTVTVRTGASAWQVMASGTGANNVRYQGSLGQIARECTVIGATMTMRVGIEGRILVGPKGGPGNVNVPLRIALVQEGPQPKPIWSKFYSVPVSVPQGASQTVFSQVEDDLTFALPPGKNLDNYIVYVGFDPKGAVATARPDAKAKTKTAPKQSTAAKPKAAPKPAKSTAPKETQPQFEPPPGSGGGAGSGVFAPPPGQSG